MTFKLTIALPNITSLILGLLSIKHASYFCTEELKLENVDVSFFVFFPYTKGQNKSTQLKSLEFRLTLLIVGTVNKAPKK